MSDQVKNPECLFLMSRLIFYRFWNAVERLKETEKVTMSKQSYSVVELPHEKTNNLHMRKQRRRSASQ